MRTEQNGREPVEVQGKFVRFWDEQDSRWKVAGSLENQDGEQVFVKRTKAYHVSGGYVGIQASVVTYLQNKDISKFILEWVNDEWQPDGDRLYCSWQALVNHGKVEDRGWGEQFYVPLSALVNNKQTQLI